MFDVGSWTFDEGTEDFKTVSGSEQIVLMLGFEGQLPG